MKTRRQLFRPACLTGSILALALSVSAHAATVTWNGAGANDNWTSAANWGGTAPVANDLLIFSGSTRLTPSNDFATNTSFGNITFAAGAGAFTLGGNQIILGGNILNSSSNLQTFNLGLNLNNVARTLDTGTAGVAITAPYTGATAIQSLTKNGSGALTLGGTWDNNNNFVRLVISAGSLNFATGANISLGAAANNTNPEVFVFQSGTTGTLAAGQTLTTRGLIKIGNTNTAQAANATFNMTGGSWTVSAGTGAAGQGRIALGEANSGAGVSVLNLSGGTLSTVGLDSNNQNGIFIGVRSHSQINHTGGTLTTGRFVFGWLASNIALASTTRGYAIGGSAILNANAQFQIATGTSGSGTRTTTIDFGDGTPGNGTVNTVPMSGGDAGSTVLWNNILNFNGAVINALAPTAYSGANSNFLAATDTVNVKVGGAIINSNGQDITFTQNLLAGSPSGGLEKRGAGNLTLSGTASTYTGVNNLVGGTLTAAVLANGGTASSIGASTNAAANLVFNGGTLGYSGATASTDRNFTISTGQHARFDVSNAATTLTLSGNSPVSTGGLVKTGAGTLALSAAQAFTGPTAINSGALLVNTSLDAASAVSIASGGTLGGIGTVGAVSTVSGSRIAPGNAGAGTLNVNSITLSPGSIFDFELGGSSDKLNITSAGGLTLTGTAFNLFDTGTATPFSGTGTFALLDYDTSFTGSPNNITIANPLIGKFYTIADNAGATTIDLTVTNTTISEWNGTAGDNLWTTAGNWTAGTPNSAGSVATFGAIPLIPTTIAVDGPKTIGSIIFSGTLHAHTITGGITDTLTFDNSIAAGTIGVTNGTHTITAPLVLLSNLNLDTTQSNDSVTVSGGISGSKIITKTGGGNAILSGTNTHAATVVNAGILTIGNGATSGDLGSGPATVDLAGTLAFDRSDAITVANNISGAGSVVKNNTNTLTLSGSNTFGTLAIGGGTVVLGSAGALPAASVVNIGAGTLDLNEKNVSISSLVGSGTITDNGFTPGITTIAANISTDSTFSGAIVDGFDRSIALSKTGAGTLTIDGSASNSFYGGTTITGGTLLLQRALGFNALVGNITIGDASGSDAIQLGASGQIGDDAVLTFTAGGSGNSAIFRLSGNNETVRGIQTTVGNAAVIENTHATFASVLTLDTAGNDYTYDGIIRNQGTATLGLIKTGTGILTLANTAVVATTSHTGTTTLNSGQLVLSNLSAWSSPIINNLTGADLIFNQTSRDLGTPAIISGPGGLTKNGPNTLTLTGVNTFTGNLIINAGTFGIGNNGAQGAGTIVMNGGTIRAAGAARAVANPVTVNASFGIGRLTDLNGTLTLTTNATITALNPDVSAVADSKLGPIAGSYTLTLAQAANGGSLSLNGTNTNTGTIIASGINSVSATGSLANAPLTVNGGTLTLNNAAQTVSALDGTGGTLALAAVNTLTVNQTTDTTFAGVISSVGSLVKTGTGKLNLTNTNSLTGPTSINGGTLAINGSLTGSLLTANAGGTLSGTGTLGTVTTAGGTIAPGNSIGTLTTGTTTLDSAATLLLELGTVTSYDILHTTGNVNLANANLSLLLQPGFGSSVDLINGNKLWILQNDGANTLTGTFASSVINVDGYQFTVTYGADFATLSPTGGNDILLTVPEPTTSLALLAGLACLLPRRRRRRRA